MSVCLFVCNNLSLLPLNVENTPKCTRLNSILVPRSCLLGLWPLALIMLWHLYDTTPLLQNFHDLSGKMNNMSLDHGRGAMLNRPPGPGGSYPPQVPSKQFPQPTRWGTYTVPILQPTHSPIYPPTNIALTHNIDHKIIRYLWFKVHHSPVWLFIASQLRKIKSSNKFPIYSITTMDSKDSNSPLQAFR